MTSFSDFIEKKFLTQNQGHVFHTAATYTTIYSEISTLITFSVFSAQNNTAHNSIVALGKRKPTFGEQLEKCVCWQQSGS